METNTTKTDISPDQTREYRDLLAKSLKAARGYTGTEASLQSVIGTVARLEEWSRQNFGVTTGRLSTDEEQILHYLVTGKTRDRSISSILDLTQKALTRCLKALDQDYLTPEEDIFIIKINGVILKPASISIIGKGDIEKRVVKIQPRLRYLIEILNKNGIYKDDVTIIEGSVDNTMVRSQSYRIVEIPRLNREVLVCNEVGEATFVIEGIWERESLTLVDKNQLQDAKGVERIIFDDRENWENKLTELLFSDRPVGNKIDIKSVENIKDAIKERCPTSTDFLSLSKKEKTTFRIKGIGFNTLLTIFGIEHSKGFTLDWFFELGKRVYGAQDEALLKAESKLAEKRAAEKFEQNDLIAKLKKLIPTPEGWAIIPLDKRKILEIQGIKFAKIFTMFDIDHEDSQDNVAFFELGIRVHGNNETLEKKRDEAQKTKELKQKNKSEIIEEIEKQFPTIDSWLSAKPGQRKKLNIPGMKITKLITYFGIEDKIFSLAGWYALGLAIFGEDEKLREKYVDAKKRESAETLSVLELSTYIKEHWPSLNEWAEVPTIQRKKLNVDGIYLTAILSRFGIIGDCYSNIPWLKLGIKVHGPDPYLVEKLAEAEIMERIYTMPLEELVKRIRSDYPTQSDWENAKDSKRDIKIDGVGLSGIGKRFCVTGDAANINNAYKELGDKIYSFGTVQL